MEISAQKVLCKILSCRQGSCKMLMVELLIETTLQSMRPLLMCIILIIWKPVETVAIDPSRRGKGPVKRTGKQRLKGNG